jgi:hypothetical protein
MPAAWVRLSPQALIALTPMKWRKKSGTMLMFTAAKKHLTIFARKREAKGAGKPIVKKIFAEVARETAGTLLREDRNAYIQKELPKRLEPYRSELGVFRKKGKSYKKPMIYEWRYEYKPGAKVKPPTNIAHIVLGAGAKT